MFIPGLEDVQVIETLSDETLVRRAKLGEEAAFAELFRRHSTKIHRTLSQITKHQQDAEDAFQDTSLKVYLHLATFDGRAKFSTWLTRIAINSALMILRKRKCYPQLSLDSEWENSEVPEWNIPDRTPSAEALLLHHELLKQLDSAIGRLKPSLRGVIDIHLRDELSNKHVADIAGLSIPATKSRLLRARGALRKSLLRSASDVAS
jgi:RNA polymerase sigma factor (sigma-70 family)